MPNVSMFFSMYLQQERLISTRVALAAPLLIASMPIAPDPAKRSRNFIPSTSNCMILKSASRILPDVGLVKSPGGHEMFLFLNVPAKIFIR